MSTQNSCNYSDSFQWYAAPWPLAFWAGWQYSQTGQGQGDKNFKKPEGWLGKCRITQTLYHKLLYNKLTTILEDDSHPLRQTDAQTEAQTEEVGLQFPELEPHTIWTLVFQRQSTYTTKSWVSQVFEWRSSDCWLSFPECRVIFVFCFYMIIFSVLLKVLCCVV